MKRCTIVFQNRSRLKSYCNKSSSKKKQLQNIGIGRISNYCDFEFLQHGLSCCGSQCFCFVFIFYSKLILAYSDPFLPPYKISYQSITYLLYFKAIHRKAFTYPVCRCLFFGHIPYKVQERLNYHPRAIISYGLYIF